MRFSKVRILQYPKRHALLFVCACALASASSLAAPVTLVPGDAAFVPDGAGPIAGTVEAGTGIPVPFVSATFNGTLTSTVYSGDITNPYGGLTFTYFLTNNVAPTPAGDIDRLTINSYDAFTVDASYQAPTPNTLPTLVDRDATGDVMGFTFLNLPGHLGNGPLHKGFHSAILVLQTNALHYQPTTAAVIDGSTVNVPSFGPSTNIPEPSTLALASLGLFILLARQRRRR